MPAIRAHCVFFLAASRAAHLVLKMGAGGVLLASAADHASHTLGAYTVPPPRPSQTTTSVRFRAFASAPIPNLVNTSGAFFSIATWFDYFLVSSSLSSSRPVRFGMRIPRRRRQSGRRLCRRAVPRSRRRRGRRVRHSRGASDARTLGVDIAADQCGRRRH
jgi:hypothetical protein